MLQAHLRASTKQHCKRTKLLAFHFINRKQYRDYKIIRINELCLSKVNFHPNKWRTMVLHLDPMFRTRAYSSKMPNLCREDHSQAIELKSKHSQLSRSIQGRAPSMTIVRRAKGTRFILLLNKHTPLLISKRLPN
jgi:hypothetical protein